MARMQGKFLFLDYLFHSRALILILITLRTSFIRKIESFPPSFDLNLTDKNYSSDAFLSKYMYGSFVAILRNLRIRFNVIIENVLPGILSPSMSIGELQEPVALRKIAETFALSKNHPSKWRCLQLGELYPFLKKRQVYFCKKKKKKKRKDNPVIVFYSR